MSVAIEVFLALVTLMLCHHIITSLIKLSNTGWYTRYNTHNGLCPANNSKNAYNMNCKLFSTHPQSTLRFKISESSITGLAYYCS